MTTPTPDFPPHITRLLDCASALCARRGSQLTAQRRLVLGLVIDSDRPVGAYQLLQRLRGPDGTAAPPTIYRALDFLIAEGLVHKIERLAAYIACTRHLQHDHTHPDHGQTVQFLICTSCGRAEELEDPPTTAALEKAAATRGFLLHSATIEAAGRCSRCLGDTRE